MAGDDSRICVFTLNAASKYPSLSTQLRKALRDIGIQNANFYKASGTDSWQFFLYWTNPISSKELEEFFGDWMKKNGFSKNEDLSFFPGEMPLVLPLQPGFEWLDSNENSNKSRSDLSMEEALNLFLTDLEAQKNDWQNVSQFKPISIKPEPSSEPVSEPERCLEVQRTSTPEDEPCHSYKATSEPITVVAESFCDQEGTDREVVAVPGGVGACSNMHQLSLFSTHTFKRGPPL